MFRKCLLSDKMRNFFFQRRVDAAGEIVPKTLGTVLYQRMFESGKSVPWIYTPEECSRYWMVSDGQDSSVINRPEEYALAPVSIVDWLEAFFSPFIEKHNDVLELGCNAGGKLNRLRELGYENLSGVELNPSCRPIMQQLFPELAQRIQLHVGSFDTVFSTLPNESHDFVYTLSAIEMVHPWQNHLFKDIARICKRYLMTVELEWPGEQYSFPRNYRRIFERYGLCQVSSTLITRHNCPEPELCCYWGHVVRLFKKENSVMGNL
jgi:SAM-dependent methyltransferase